MFTLVIMIIFSVSYLSNQTVSYTQPTLSIIPQQAVKSIRLSIYKEDNTNGNFMSEYLFFYASPSRPPPSFLFNLSSSTEAFLHFIASEKVETISFDSFLLLLQVIVPRAPKAKWNKHRLWDLDGIELKPLLCLFPSVWFEASHLFSINLIWKRIFLDICEDDIWFTPRYYVPWRFFISLSLSFLILGKIKDVGGNKGIRGKSSYSLKDNIGIKYR